MVQPTDEHRVNQRRVRSIPRSLVGAMAGLAFWLAAFLVAITIDDWDALLADWVLDWVGIPASFCVVVAFPIYMGGWFFIWGDNGPPAEWMKDLLINGCLGVLICTGVGALRGRLTGR